MEPEVAEQMKYLPSPCFYLKRYVGVSITLIKSSDAHLYFNLFIHLEYRELDMTNKRFISLTKGYFREKYETHNINPNFQTFKFTLGTIQIILITRKRCQKAF